MQTKQLLCTHGELEAACAICFVSDLKTQLRECEKQLEKAEEVIDVLWENDLADRTKMLDVLQNYFKEKRISDGYTKAIR